ncbi:MAG: hypothetical protein HYV96_11055 [Opitutae bacterium]|nr:hypothetical protein [Opitutae bacterium]
MRCDLESIRAGLPEQHVVFAGKLGLELRPSVDRVAWAQLVGHLTQATRGVTQGADTLVAWLGDALAYGGGKYRGRIADYAHAAGLHATTLRNAKLVCARIPLSRRRDTLTWSHHCEVGKSFSDPDEIERWLLLAESENLSRAELRRRISASKKTVQGSVRSAAEAAPFALLRELRAVERLLQREQPAWHAWSPDVCRHAMGEIEGLGRFIDQVRERASYSHSSRAS